MKASKFGTWTEQKLYRAKWVNGKANPHKKATAENPRVMTCSTCDISNSELHCYLIDCKTQKTAFCKNHSDNAGGKHS